MKNLTARMIGAAAFISAMGAMFPTEAVAYCGYEYVCNYWGCWYRWICW
jgi:hypothetical protein